MYNQLGALSPLDGRYSNSVKELNGFFSEAAIMRYRIYVEVEYLIALSFEKKIEELKVPMGDLKRFRFRLYFDSSCPHCERMMSTAQDLQKIGYFVEVRQIDDRKPNFPVPFPIIQASKSELLDKKIDSWPVLFVADTKNKLIYRINGFQTSQSLLNALSKK